MYSGDAKIFMKEERRSKGGARMANYTKSHVTVYKRLIWKQITSQVQCMNFPKDEVVTADNQPESPHFEVA